MMQLRPREGGYSHWLQYAYARTAKVPFWHILVPLRVGISSNAPLRVGFLTPNNMPERVWFFRNLGQKKYRKPNIALMCQNLLRYMPKIPLIYYFCAVCASKGMHFGQNLCR